MVVGLEDMGSAIPSREGVLPDVGGLLESRVPMGQDAPGGFLVLGGEGVQPAAQGLDEVGGALLQFTASREDFGVRGFAFPQAAE